jgi:hypothetical protein
MNEKGCKSCNNDEWFFNRWCWIDDKGDTCHIQIKYCPLCGRLLKESEKE